jgi:hypothetical protein
MRFIDLSGKRFGRLVAQWPVGIKQRGKTKAGTVYWLCSCDCGQLKITSGHNLRTSDTQSCGCLALQLSQKRIKHGFNRRRKPMHPLYWTWKAMLGRCSNPANASYPYYGGRGVVVCERWRPENNGFKSFIDDMGNRPLNATLDRRNVNGNYCPENCQWSTAKEQIANRRKFCLDRFSNDMLITELKRRGVSINGIRDE